MAVRVLEGRTFQKTNFRLKNCQTNETEELYTEVRESKDPIDITIINYDAIIN